MRHSKSRTSVREPILGWRNPNSRSWPIHDLGSGTYGCSLHAVVYMIFKLLKISLKPLREITGLRIVSTTITPGVSWIKNLTGNIGAGLRHQYAEVRIWSKLDFTKAAIKSCVYHGPGISDFHSLADTIAPT